MSLFGFGNILFNKTERTGLTVRDGPLKVLNDSESDSSLLRYPFDLGTYDKAHYMIFSIKEQNYEAEPADSAIAESVNPTESATPATSGPVIRAYDPYGVADGTRLYWDSDLNLEVSSDLNAQSKPTPIDIIGGNQQTTVDNRIVKRITKTTGAIALYMPDTLMYTYQQSYDQVAMGGELLGQIIAAVGRGAISEFQQGKGSVDSIKKAALGFKNQDFGKAAAAAGLIAKQTILDAVGSATGQTSATRIAGAAILGVVRNPLLELIYSSPNFRTFQFDFSFYPRDEKEALEVQKIIEKFRFHHAPKFSQQTVGFLTPPSEFDIQFYYSGTINPNIPKISTCVLTQIDVNYAPNGFSAYETVDLENNTNNVKSNQASLGATGMPVAINMNLQFTEKTYLTKDDFNNNL